MGPLCRDTEARAMPERERRYMAADLEACSVERVLTKTSMTQIIEFTASAIRIIIMATVASMETPLLLIRAGLLILHASLLLPGCCGVRSMVGVDMFIVKKKQEVGINKRWEWICLLNDGGHNVKFYCETVDKLGAITVKQPRLLYHATKAQDKSLVSMNRYSS